MPSEVFEQSSTMGRVFILTILTACCAFITTLRILTTDLIKLARSSAQNKLYKQ